MKHTYWLAIVVAALCVSCATNQILPLPAPVAKLPPITQPIQLVSESSHKTEIVAAKITAQVDNLKDQTAALDDKMAQLDKTMADAKPTIESLAASQAMVHAAHSQVDEMIAKMTDLQTANVEMAKSLQETQANIVALVKAGQQKDEETKAIREQVVVLTDKYLAADKRATVAEKKIVSMTPAYELGIKVRWVCAIIVLLVVLYIGLRILVSMGKITLPFAL
ncbi:MAG: hypothetical protein WCS43_11870 [Verrucomicrobiota bacterium]